MEKSTQYCFLLTALIAYILICRTDARDFLSISCGGAQRYIDQRSIQWVTDEDYIQTGKSLQLLDADSALASLRYFPEGRSKNCFILPVKNETTYLIRASFDPGNVTSGPALDSPIDFNITVNSNLWFSYYATTDDRPIGWIESIIHTFEKTETYLCLVKGSQGYPFINAIELRELNITSYVKAKAGKFFVYSQRGNTGTDPDDTSIVRFPDDPYDRIWFPTPYTKYPAFPRVENLSLPSPPTTGAQDGYNWPPTKVLQDAWVGRNLSSSSFVKPDGAKELYVALYVKEIRPANLTDLEANPVGMIIGVNDFTREVNLTTTDDWTLGITVDVETDLHVTVTIISQPWSKRDAILNGYEIHVLQDVDTSSTNSKDRTALDALQKSFNLLDWTGDPCYPVAWDWVTCDPRTLRINKLLLSKANISGSIPEEISTMTDLTEIHLDNNNLTGSIPQSMSFLVKLEVLALDNNNLSGQIPVTFQNRAGFTFSGNPGLCLPGNVSCEVPPAAAPPVPSAAMRRASDEINDRKLTIGMIVALGLVSLAWN